MLLERRRYEMSQKDAVKKALKECLLYFIMIAMVLFLLVILVPGVSVVVGKLIYYFSGILVGILIGIFAHSSWEELD